MTQLSKDERVFVVENVSKEKNCVAVPAAFRQ